MADTYIFQLMNETGNNNVDTEYHGGEKPNTSDDKLSFKKHFQELNKAIVARINLHPLIGRNRRLDLRQKMTLIKSIILTYASQVRGHITKTTRQILQHKVVPLRSLDNLRRDHLQRPGAHSYHRGYEEEGTKSVGQTWQRPKQESPTPTEVRPPFMPDVK